jgi:pSer/pThr/pTyr-binding forkhead associated (FHA) protein
MGMQGTGEGYRASSHLAWDSGTIHLAMWDENNTFDTPTIFDRAMPASGELVALRIVMLAGSRAGQVYEIQDEMLIGRQLGAAIRVDEPSVSREHAMVRRDTSGQLIAEDLGSRNGTHVNGARVDRQALRVGDRINIGPKVVLMLTLKDTLEEQRLQSQKLESIGRIAGGIAHDFNNLLAAIMANVHYLRRLKTLEEEEVRACMDEIKLAAEQGADLTRQLLGFARRGKYEESPVDLQTCPRAW